MTTTLEHKTSTAYDKSGNVLDMGVQLNVWNQKGQLIHVTGARGGTVSYKYDALGRRVEKDVGGVITRYVYDGINLIAETDAAGTEKAWYVHGGLDRPLVRIASDGSVSYYHADILGSVIALTDASGTVTTTYRYSPFGETVVEGTDIAQPFRFTGREWDAETGLYYYRARYYSPEMKRFITEDPIRFAAGDVNFYAYVGNNPGSFVDPLGLKVRIIITRIYDSGKTTQGLLSAQSDRLGIHSVHGYTIEPTSASAYYQPDSDSYRLAPTGTYDAFIRTGHDQNRIELIGVPGFGNVQVHSGNNPADTSACLLVGSYTTEDHVWDSKNTMNKVLDLIAADGSNDISVSIYGNPTVSPFQYITEGLLDFYGY